MKTEKYHLVLAIMVGILSVPALGEVEFPRTVEADLIGRPYPTLAEIEQLYVVIVTRHSQPDEDGLLLKELEQSVRDKLKDAHITVAEDDVDKMKSDFKKVLLRRLKEKDVQNLRFRSINIPELRIAIDALKLTDSQQYVFRIQTSVVRAVCLSREHRPLFKADVWKAVPAMQVVPLQNMPAVVSNKVLEQIEEFIHAYVAANPPSVRPSDAEPGDTVLPTSPEAVSKQPAEQAVAMYKYVASRNSNVFHSPDCRWAKKISSENLVGYNSREDAIKDGKRPCRWCKP